MRITRRAFAQAGPGAGVLAAAGGGLRAREALINATYSVIRRRSPHYRRWHAIPGMTNLRHVEDTMRAGPGLMPNAAQRRQQEAFFDAL